jgi:hypothetical protein
MVKPTIRQTAIPSKSIERLSQLEADAADIFELDRSALVLGLRSLWRAIDEGAEEMEMVAIENVFGKSLSRALTRKGRKLRLAAKDLNRIIRLVEQAHVPKAQGRPTPKRNRSRPKKSGN